MMKSSITLGIFTAGLSLSAFIECAANAPVVQGEAVIAPRAGTVASGPTLDTSYLPLAGKILNPERGFHSVASLTNGPWPQTTNYSYVRKAGNTLVRAAVRLDNFRDKPLPQTLLDEMKISLAAARSEGLKVLLHVAYNAPSSGTPDYLSSSDAPLDIVLSHLDQLKPVIQENADVIFALETGFVGAWGEWHTSSNGLDKGVPRQTVFDKIHEILPQDRTIQIRTLEQLKALLPNKLDSTTAYTNTKTAKTGLANLCFLSNYSDAGTYLPDSDIEQNKQYLADVSKYALIGGEVCEVTNSVGRRDDCAGAKTDLTRYHYTFLNSIFYTPVLQGWKDQGCHNEIDDKLGYRFELKSSRVSASVIAGNALKTNIVLRNVGYAAPVNPRGFALVLRNQTTGEIYLLQLRSNRIKAQDPRMWLPEEGDITIDVSPLVPANATAGTYDVFMSLYDPASGLSARPEYSIRLANENVWEEKTGWNLMVKGLQITK
jgi:hypothetical protein